MPYTNKQATAKKIKWTPPDIVKQHQKGNPTYSYRNQQNCPNSSSQNQYDTGSPTSKKYHSFQLTKTAHHNQIQNPTPHHTKTTTNITTTTNTTNHNNSPHHQTPPKNKNKPNYIDRKDDILLPLKTFVESLPSFLQSSTQETALVLLHCTDEYDRRREMAEFFRQDPSYIPISARIKHKLTSSELLQHDHIYLENSSNCAKVVELTQKLLRKYTFNVVRREVWAAKHNLLHKYIKHGLTVTQMLIVFEKIQQKKQVQSDPIYGQISL